MAIGRLATTCVLLSCLVHGIASDQRFDSQSLETVVKRQMTGQHRVKRYMGAMMGKIDACDDARNQVEVDWPNYDFREYTCPGGERYPVDKTVQSKFFSEKMRNPDFDPTHDVVWHRCMNETLQYPDKPPLRGEHRPNWGVYGEYLYIPPQRWLHNLEHGSVVMLYHPCAAEEAVATLRRLVRNCIYRHVITPYRNLTMERPLALVTWGNKLEMNNVDAEEVVDFIKTHARNAPEDLSKQGKYKTGLVTPARIVSDLEDEDLCPWTDTVPPGRWEGQEPVFELEPWSGF